MSVRGAELVIVPLRRDQPEGEVEEGGQWRGRAEEGGQRRVRPRLESESEPGSEPTPQEAR